jgi:Zn-dependent protease with chaperone function
VTGGQLMPHRLEAISPKAYEHPADRAATAALKKIPKLDLVVRKLIEFQYERALRQSFLASSIKLGPEQLPETWAGYERVLATLDMPETYDLYVTQWPLANAATIGSEKPMIVLNSAAVSLLDEAELQTVLAHEAGHILSDHVLYRTALMILLQLSLTRLPLVAGVPLIAVRAALLEWFRATELSCDRAATLVNRDPLVTCRTMMVMAGGANSRKLNLDAFLKQASEYEEWGSGWDRMSRFFVELGLTHDFPVRRVHEVMKWVRSGEYDRIIGGDYLRRGDDDVDPRAAAGEAVDHYAERFRRLFRDAQEEVEKASGKLSDWLKYGG